MTSLAAISNVLFQLGAFVFAVLANRPNHDGGARGVRAWLKGWTVVPAAYAGGMACAVCTRALWFAYRNPDEWQPVVESLAALGSLLCCYYSFRLWRASKGPTA